MNGHAVCLDNELLSIKVSNHLSFVKVESENNHHFLKKNFNFRAATNYYFLLICQLLFFQLINESFIKNSEIPM